MMRLTIVPVDNFVAVDNISRGVPLDLSGCGIPSNIHALQWYDNRGWIEYENPTDPFAIKPTNLDIYSLPEWAISCVSAYNNYVVPVVTPEEPPEEGA